MRTLTFKIPDCESTLTTKYFFHLMPDLPKSTVYSRIRSLVNSGVLKRIGRGVYERSDNADFELHISPKMKDVAKELSLQFPYIDFCVWDLTPINSLAQHLINFNICILDVDRDAVEAVYQQLRDMHEKVVTTKRLVDNLADYNNYILVRKLVTDSPLMKKTEATVPTLEKLLVDIACDKEFATFQGYEMQHIFDNALAQYIINRNKLLRYAGRKNQLEKIEQLLINNSSIK